MEVSYVEDIASRNDPESCVCAGNRVGEALTEGDAGWVLSHEKLTTDGDADAVDVSGRQNRHVRYREDVEDLPWSETLCMHPSTSSGNREVPWSNRGGAQFRIGNSEEVTR